MSSPTRSWAHDADRFSGWGPDRLYGDDRVDDWSRDEWWRAQNPGASLMRGMLWALPVAAVMWLAMAAAVWFVFSL